MNPGEAAAQARGRERILLALLFWATASNYLDRQALSVAAPVLRAQLGLSSIGYSRVIFVFLLGYTIGQTPAGKVIDKVGTRLGMLLCVAVWSTVTTLHGLAAGVISLGVLRFLLGVAEAGNWPGGIKAVSENLPPDRRAFGVGVFNSGSAAGALLAPPLVVAIMGLWGWGPMFVVIGITGFLWTLLWARPPLRGEASLDDAGAQPSLRCYLRQKALWGLLVGRFFSDPTWWFYAFWLPDYLAQRRGFDLMTIGRTARIPFVFVGVGGWLGGYASDGLIRRGWFKVSARKLVMGLSALLMLCGIPAFQAHSSAAALAWISLVLFGYSSWASNILSLPVDLFKSEVVGQVAGLCSTTAAIGGMGFTLVTGWLVQRGILRVGVRAFLWDDSHRRWRNHPDHTQERAGRREHGLGPGRRESREIALRSL
jgi:ACS family hexuronate transporter-like MFS transporter